MMRPNSIGATNVATYGQLCLLLTLLTLLTLLMLFLLLGGCTMVGSLPSVGRPAEPPVPVKPSAPSMPVQEAVYGTTAVIDLMSRARDFAAQGDHAAAGVAIERALRIEPQNPALWYNLGVNHHRQKDYTQCENASLKSLSAISSRHSLYTENWRLILECRTRLGDRSGADAARQHLKSLEN